MDEDLIEEKISSENIYEGKLLKVKRDKVKLPNGHTSYREWINHPGASAVIPYLPDGKIVLVKQYRYPVQQVTIEIPAGKLDVEGENPLECAIRELKEETGYAAEKYTKLTTIATTVGFSNELIHIYAAENLSAGTQCPDGDEFINVITVPLEEAVSMISNEVITDAKSVTAILLLKEMLAKRGA